MMIRRFERAGLVVIGGGQYKGVVLRESQLIEIKTHAFDTTSLEPRTLITLLLAVSWSHCRIEQAKH